MRLVKCHVCGGSNHAAFHDYDRPEYNRMYYSDRINDYLHPSCLNAILGQIEKVYGIPAAPIRRLLNFGAIRNQQDGT